MDDNMDNYVDMILLKNNIDYNKVTIDMDEIDKYVDMILKIYNDKQKFRKQTKTIEHTKIKKANRCIVS